MNKSKEILNLETIYDIVLERINKEEFDERAGYVIDENNQVTQLSFYDKEIAEIKGFEHFSNLQKLNLSYNKITEIKGLDNLLELKTLELSNNRITEIKGLDNLKKLEILRISNNNNSYNLLKEFEAIENRIENKNKNKNIIPIEENLVEIKGLDKLTNLLALDLSHNKISEIKGIDTLTTLKILNLSYNDITEIKGLDNLTNLAILNISNSGSWIKDTLITEIKGLDNLFNLQSLLIGGNKISKIEGLGSLSRLIKLDLSYNQIVDMDYLEKTIRQRGFKELYIFHNPFEKIKSLKLKEKTNNRNDLLRYFYNIEREKDFIVRVRKTCERENRVTVLLGAGATIDIGGPTTQQITDDILNEKLQFNTDIFNNEEDEYYIDETKKSIVNLKQIYNILCNKCHPYHRNFETIFYVAEILASYNLTWRYGDEDGISNPYAYPIIAFFVSLHKDILDIPDFYDVIRRYNTVIARDI